MPSGRVMPSWMRSGARKAFERSVKRLPRDGAAFTLLAMIYPSRKVTLRSRIPTVRVHVVTDDGELTVRARWKDRPIDLQRRISFLMRQGHAVFLEDEWGRTICLQPERICGATVDGRGSAAGFAPGFENGAPESASTGPRYRSAGGSSRGR